MAMSDIPNSIMIGIITGVLGAGFIFINNYAGLFRKKVLTTKFRKCLECVTLISITATVMYFSTMIFKSECKKFAPK